MPAERPDYGVPPHVVETEPHVLGHVVPGDQRGRTLGFPTANLVLGPDGPPVTDGVYVGAVLLRSGQPGWAAVSIGTRPTYYGSTGARLLEAHVLDFAGDLYDHVLPVWLLQCIRLQVAFCDEQSLVDRLERDVDHVRRFAARAPFFRVSGITFPPGLSAGMTDQGGSW